MEKRRNCSLAISPLFHNIFTSCSISCLAGTSDKRLFEISEFEITRVSCSLVFQSNDEKRVLETFADSEGPDQTAHPLT